MPGVTFKEENNKCCVIHEGVEDGDDDSDDHDSKISMEFKAQFADSLRPDIDASLINKDVDTVTTLSYKVVGRLSRWEGGFENPYKDAEVDNNKVQAEKMSVGEVIRQFVRPSYDFTEISIEDIQRVKIMHDRFVNDAQYNFNYSTMLLIASIIAAFGLGSGSEATIIASMLVSPLMGPVTAIAYGISIGDYKMVRMGLVTEITSLIFCILIGIIISTIMQNFPFLIEDPLPHPEQMLSRGSWQNFYCGIPIAFFSGLGVAVGLLDSQTNSLVGVAISASLLPPAVNAGMLWVLGDSRYGDDGLISISLTIMNIALIIIASILMFRLKEILPIEKSIFWSDLGVARKIYHNVAILPLIDDAPCESEIQKRVTRFFPRASTMAADMDPDWAKS